MDSYEQYEQDCARIRKDNEIILANFRKWLSDKELSSKTIESHLENIDFYINEFEEKCKSKDLSHSDFPEKMQERFPQYKARWESSMSEQIKELPEFDQVLRVVQRHIKKMSF